MSDVLLIETERKLLVGNFTPEYLVELGLDLNDIKDLGTLLIGPAEIEATCYDRAECDDWGLTDYQSYGRWIHTLINKTAPDAGPPTSEIYQRAYLLGVGPSPKRIRNRFSSLWSFNDQLGFEGSYSRGKYDDWTTRDFIDYGRTVVHGVGERKPKKADFQRWFEKRRGPSPVIIQDKIGGIGRLQELLGYPYIPDWTEEDFIEYGVKVIKANPNIKLNRAVFDELSKRKRGPSTRCIVKHFNTLSKYKDLISQEATIAKEIEQQEQIEKVKERFELSERGRLPSDMVENTVPGDPKEFLRQTAIFILADRLLAATVTENEKARLAELKSRSITSAIQNLNPAISAGTIESTALQLGLFDDIWPMDDYLRQLAITKQPVTH